MKKRIGIVILTIGILFIVGVVQVKKQNQVSETVINQYVKWAQEIQNSGGGELQKSITEDEFKAFFEVYFGLDEMLFILNQKENQIDTTNGELYKQQVALFLSVFKDYIDPEIIKLKDEKNILYLFHMPRLVQVGKYIIGEKQNVQQVSIKGISPVGENLVYEVSVVTKSPAVVIDGANKLYEWSEEQDYYLFLQNLSIQDTIKVEYTYYVEVTKGNSFKICSIKEGGFLPINKKDRKLIGNNGFIQKLAYKEEKVEDENLVIDMMYILLNQPKTFFEDWESAYEKGESFFEVLFSSHLQFKEKIIVDEKYRVDYTQYMSPYRDGTHKVTLHKEDIKCQPHINSTEKNPIFYISTSSTRFLQNQMKQVYECTYLVAIKEGKIKSIHFIKGKVLQTNESI